MMMRVKAIVEIANNASMQLDEISYGKLEKLSLSLKWNSDLESLEARMSNYYDLFRKLSVNDVDGLLEKLAEFKNDVSFVE